MPLHSISVVYNSISALLAEVTQDRDEPFSYPYWIVCISGPFVFAAAVIHAAIWKPYSLIVGAIVSYERWADVCTWVYDWQK